MPMNTENDTDDKKMNGHSASGVHFAASAKEMEVKCDEWKQNARKLHLWELCRHFYIQS